MVICKVCGEEVNDSKFCPNCGSVMDSKPKEETVEEVFEEETIDVNQEETQNTAQNNNTKFCTNCGSEIDMNAAICPECGVTLIHSSNAQQASKKFCTNCGSEIDINAVVCPHCGVAAQGAGFSQPKSPAIGIILNFFIPGLGHIASDFTHRGLNFLVMYFVSVALMFLLIGFILVPIIWIWSMVDVNKCVNAANAGEYVEEKIIF